MDTNNETSVNDQKMNNIAEQTIVPAAPQTEVQPAEVASNASIQLPTSQTPTPEQQVVASTTPSTEPSTQPVTPLPTQTPVNQPVEAPKKKSNMPIIIIVIVVLAVAGYFIYNKMSNGSDGSTSSQSSSSKGSNCIEDVHFEGSMSMDGVTGIAVGDTQYVFDTSFDADFISSLSNFDDIKINLCYSNKKPSTNFQVGSTTKSKTVESIELFDKNTNKKLNATNTKDLLKELGYHSFGKHTEEATLISISSSSSFGFSGGESYESYDTEIEFANGRKVNAEYKVFKGQTDKSKQLQQGQKYTFDFEVEEDTFDVFSYTITDFN